MGGEGVRIVPLSGHCITFGYCILDIDIGLLDIGLVNFPSF